MRKLAIFLCILLRVSFSSQGSFLSGISSVLTSAVSNAEKLETDIVQNPITQLGNITNTIGKLATNTIAQATAQASETSVLSTISNAITDTISSGIANATKVQSDLVHDLTQSGNIINAIGKTITNNIGNVTQIFGNSVLSTVSSTIASGIANATKLQDEILQNAMKATSGISEIIEDVIKNTITAAIAQNTEIIKNIISKFLVDPTSCISLTIDVNEILEAIITNMLSCVNEIFIDIIAYAKILVQSLGDSTTTLGTYAIDAIACIAQINTFDSCMKSVSESLSTWESTTWTELLTDVKNVCSGFGNLQTILGTCGLSAITTVFANEAQEYYQNLTTCLTRLYA